MGGKLPEISNIRGKFWIHLMCAHFNFLNFSKTDILHWHNYSCWSNGWETPGASSWNRKQGPYAFVELSLWFCSSRCLFTPLWAPLEDALSLRCSAAHLLTWPKLEAFPDPCQWLVGGLFYVITLVWSTLSLSFVLVIQKKHSLKLRKPLFSLNKG